MFYIYIYIHIFVLIKDMYGCMVIWVTLARFGGYSAPLFLRYNLNATLDARDGSVVSSASITAVLLSRRAVCVLCVMRVRVCMCLHLF